MTELPKVKDVLIEFIGGTRYTMLGIDLNLRIRQAMHEYGRILLNVAAESAEMKQSYNNSNNEVVEVYLRDTLTTSGDHFCIHKQSILKLKEMLK